MALFALFLTLSAAAQTVGLKAGYTHSHIRVNTGDSILWKESKFVPGFNVGGTLEFARSDHFSLITGIGFTTKGAKGERQQEFNVFTPSPSYAIYYYKLNILNLEIPFQAKLTFNLGDFKLYSALGPYGGLSLVARSLSWYENKFSFPAEHFPGTPLSGEGSLRYNDDIQLLDYGVLGTVGIEHSGISFSASFSYGLANLSDGGLTDDYQIRNRSFEFSVGYRFGE